MDKIQAYEVSLAIWVAWSYDLGTWYANFLILFLAPHTIDHERLY